MRGKILDRELKDGLWESDIWVEWHKDLGEKDSQVGDSKFIGM